MATWLTQVFSAFSKPFKWWVVVAPWEAGLRVRLGKTSKKLKPGVHFRIPFLDRVYVRSVRLRAIHDQNQTIETADGKVVTISIALEFTISDIQRLYSSIASPESTLILRSAALVAEWVNAHNHAELSIPVIEAAVSAHLPGEQWGLLGLRVKVIGLATVRTYRILMNDYRSLTGLDDMAEDEGR